MTVDGVRRHSFRHAARAAQVTAFDEGDGIFEGVAVVYRVVDDYGSVWAPGCFNDFLKTRMPTITWGHNWQEPVGLVVDWKDTTEGLVIVGQLDDPESVPRAKQAWAQLRSGSMTDLSVGFFYLEKRDPTPEEAKAFPGAKEIIEKAGLDEIAIVLRGAVPGAMVQSTRGGHVVRRRRDSQVPAAVIDAGRAHGEAMRQAQLEAAERRRAAAAAAAEVDELLEVGADEWLRRQGIDPEPIAAPALRSGGGGFVNQADVFRLAEAVQAGRMTEGAAKAELRRLARP